MKLIIYITEVAPLNIGPYIIIECPTILNKIILTLLIFPTNYHPISDAPKYT